MTVLVRNGRLKRVLPKAFYLAFCVTKQFGTTRWSSPFVIPAMSFGRARGSNLRPLGPKPRLRQKRKFLSFLKLQPPQIYWGFHIASHWLRCSIRGVLGILVTNLPQVFWTATRANFRHLRLAEATHAEQRILSPFRRYSQHSTTCYQIVFTDVSAVKASYVWLSTNACWGDVALIL
jgi:hypothetical protein